MDKSTVIYPSIIYNNLSILWLYRSMTIYSFFGSINYGDLSIPGINNISKTSKSQCGLCYDPIFFFSFLDTHFTCAARLRIDSRYLNDLCMFLLLVSPSNDSLTFNSQTYVLKGAVSLYINSSSVRKTQ